eukprot:124150_1
MSSISNLARCDRKLAIICHTPTSINNLMHRYDIYQYCNTDGVVDGYYYDMENWNLEMVHRYTNIEQLSISLGLFENDKIEIFNSFNNIKHLSLYHEDQVYGFDEEKIRVIPSLQTLSIVTCVDTCIVLGFIDKYTMGHKLKSIAFVDVNCDSFEDMGYDNP